MKNSRGFTILEVSIVMVILGAMASLTLMKYKKTIAHNELEKASWNFLSQLSGSRSLAMKNDAGVFVKFSANACTVFVDTSADGVPQSAEKSSVYAFPPNIAIGIAGSGPTSGPDSIAFHSSGIAGTWGSMLTISNDAIGTINDGAIYIKSNNLTKINYCIGITSSMQSIKIYKWSGSTWLNL